MFPYQMNIMGQDPWQASRATLGMMRGMGLEGQQQAQGGIPINGSMQGQDQPQQTVEAQDHQGGAMDGLASAAKGASGLYSQETLKDRMAKRGQVGFTAPQGPAPGEFIPSGTSLDRIALQYPMLLKG